MFDRVLIFRIYSEQQKIKVKKQQISNCDIVLNAESQRGSTNGQEAQQHMMRTATVIKSALSLDKDSAKLNLMIAAMLPLCFYLYLLQTWET